MNSTEGQSINLTHPPEVGPQVMIAKAIPRAKAKPTWRRLPYAASSLFRMNEAVAAIPGKTYHISCVIQV